MAWLNLAEDIAADFEELGVLERDRIALEQWCAWRKARSDEGQRARARARKPRPPKERRPRREKPAPAPRPKRGPIVLRAPTPPPPLPVRPCVECGTVFAPNTTQTITCSVGCAQSRTSRQPKKPKRARGEVACACGERFVPHHHSQKFCTTTCSSRVPLWAERAAYRERVDREIRERRARLRAA